MGPSCHTADCATLLIVQPAEKMVDHGIHILAIKDMAGLLKPRAATMLVRPCSGCQLMAVLLGCCGRGMHVLLTPRTATMLVLTVCIGGGCWRAVVPAHAAGAVTKPGCRL